MLHCCGRIEHQAQERAKQEHDHEKRELQYRMETELAELQAQLKLFQKVKFEIRL